MGQLVGLAAISPRAGYGHKKLRTLSRRVLRRFPMNWDSTRNQYVAHEAAIVVWEAEELEAQITVEEHLTREAS